MSEEPKDNIFGIEDLSIRLEVMDTIVTDLKKPKLLRGEIEVVLNNIVA